MQPCRLTPHPDPPYQCARVPTTRRNRACHSPFWAAALQNRFCLPWFADRVSDRWATARISPSRWMRELILRWLGPLPAASRFPGSFPYIGLGLWTSGGVHVDIAVKVEIEPFENRDQSLDVIVGWFAGIHREVAVEQDLFLRNVRDNQSIGVRRRIDVVHLNGSRPIGVDLLLGYSFKFRFLRILGEGVAHECPGSVERFIEELLIVFLGDDDCALRN